MKSTSVAAAPQRKRLAILSHVSFQDGVKPALEQKLNGCVSNPSLSGR